MAEGLGLEECGGEEGSKAWVKETCWNESDQRTGSLLPRNPVDRRIGSSAKSRRLGGQGGAKPIVNGSGGGPTPVTVSGRAGYLTDYVRTYAYVRTVCTYVRTYGRSRYVRTHARTYVRTRACVRTYTDLRTYVRTYTLRIGYAPCTTSFLRHHAQSLQHPRLPL